MGFEAPARANIIAAVRSAVRSGDLVEAERLARRRLDGDGRTPEMLEALSWVARGALVAHRFTKASDYAKQVRRSVLRRLRTAELDSQPHLPAALGASIEVLAQAMANRGHRSEAAGFLKRELARFGDSSIRFRIRKNLNLLTIEGQPAPDLETREWLGPKPSSLRELRGRSVLLFFWAHYCEDSRAQGRVLVRVRDEFTKRGLLLIAPTRRYGHLDEQGRKPAGRKKEMEHIQEVLARYYPDLADTPIPVSERNFEIYGVSTTPTLALVDPSGIVSLYHPGKISYGDLAASIRGTLNTRLTLDAGSG